MERERPAKPGLLALDVTHNLLPRRACIFTVHPASNATQTVAMQLMREACVLEALHHPGVPRVYECGILPDRRPWFATELIDGPTIADRVDRDGPLSMTEVLELIADVGEILHHAHGRGLVHANLRPDGIAHRTEGPCVLDWAAARGRDADPGEPLTGGAADYQPPEVVAGAPIDSRADVFALGVIAYEALAGARPVLAAVRRFPGAPARLTTLLDRMLAYDPSARPTSAELRAEALAISAQLEVVPTAPPVEEDSVQVHIEDVELDLGAETETGLELEAEAEAVAAVATDEAPMTKRPGKLRWTPQRLFLDPQQTKTEPMPSGFVLDEVARSRTLTEPMPIAGDGAAAATAPEPARTSTPIGKLALPSRILDPSRRRRP